MYAYHRQLHAPTGVENSLYCNFFSSKEHNLVVAGTNNLTVYRLNMDVEVLSKQQDKPGEKVKKQKLELLGQFSLFGNIMSMQAVKLAGNSRDSLLVSFRDAKLSILDYDPGTHDLKTSSLHYFEEEEMKDGHMQQVPNIPYVRVDPDGRCAAMLIFGTRLVILPFRREQATEEEALMPGSNKGPIMSSYTIDIRKLDEKITNVKDFQFLHGYYEPTIFILYEPLPTWSGRVAVRKDSCSIVAISLNIAEKVHPIIWSLGGLPFDTFMTIAIPKPIGGVMLFACNSLMYLNQSVPPYGVSLNSITDFSTEFLLKVQEGVKITMDCCQACLIDNERMVVSLRGGELYVVTLVVDGMRAVRSFHFDKAAASVLTTCMCLCEDGFLFLGSRLGNSLLLKYTQKAGDTTALTDAAKPSDEPPTKKKKADQMGDWMAKDVSQLDDLDELEVYGRSTEIPAGSTAHIASYMFEVCDSILNIGPCGNAVMGEPAFLSEEFSNLLDPDLELVTTSGYGKNGALSILQRSVRPQVVTTFELPGCLDMWTVYGPPEHVEKVKTQLEKGEESVENGHAFLILSRDDSSMVLETGQEIMELDHSGFSTQGPTVHAGNLGSNKYILQVSATGVRLMDGVNQLQHIPVDMGSPIASCSIADPYVVIMSEAGNIMLMTLKEDAFGGGVRLLVKRPDIHTNSQVVTVCAYKDVSGMFTTKVQDEEEQMSPEKTNKSAMDTSTFSMNQSVDDEDELLYGDVDSQGEESKPEEVQETKPLPHQEADRSQSILEPTYWAVMARDSGVLEIYSMPNFKLHFMVKNFPVAHKVLVDSGQLISDLQKPSGSEKPSSELNPVYELLIVGLGHKQSRPHLLARVGEELYLYEAFPYNSTTPDERLKLRFKKLQHTLIVKEKKSKKRNEDSKSKKKEENGENGVKLARSKWFRPFHDISGYSGVFVCGPYPHWLFMSTRGALRIHPMSIDGSVTCFAPFHNVNCPRGFLYFNRQGELRISVLPTHLSYDAPWPVRKVALRCTPRYVAYHPESKTYSVCTSTPEPCNRLVKVQGEGDKEFETIERDERYIYPFLDKFSVQLFSPVSWEAIPNTKMEVEDFEHVTCMRSVSLKSEGTLSGLKGFVALGTNNAYGEDVTCRGRIIIFDVIEVVPEPGQPLTKNKIKIVYDKEQKGPVSAIDHVQGFLVSAIGQKIYIWQLKDRDLMGVAFIDTQVYICSMCVVKNMILVGDVLKSVSLLRYQTDMKVLSFVSRDIKPLEVYSLAFVIDNTNMGFLVSDKEKNFIIYSYQPEIRESAGGQRLLRKADFNMGSHVNTFFRIRCKLTDPSTEKTGSSSLEKRHINFFATLDGSIGFVIPLPEKTYRRLFMLQNALNVHLPHLAGLNPKAYRLLHHERRALVNPQKNILDGDLLVRYLFLSLTERADLARRIGTSIDQLIDDLMDLDRLTAHF